MSSSRECISIYYQSEVVTNHQVRNLIHNTVKGYDRPVVLFSDNDRDNVTLCEDNNRTRRVRMCSSSSSRVCTLDNYFNADFLSVGIITDCFHIDDTDTWKKCVDQNFRYLCQLIEAWGVSEIVIPGSNGNHALGGSHLPAEGYNYIQDNINVIVQRYQADIKCTRRYLVVCVCNS